MLISPGNRNESPEHYELKQIAKYLLWSRGCKMIATEVYGFYGNIMDFPDRRFSDKNIIDTVGVDFKQLRNKTPRIKLIGMEAKVSLSDFRNGFCTACELTYIIAPAGIVPPEELPDGIGLIEVDLGKYQISRVGDTIGGIQTTVQARNRLCSRFENKESYMKWAFKQVPRIAYRVTAVDLFKKPEIFIPEQP